MGTGVAPGGVDLARDTFDAEAWLVAAPAEPWLEGLPTEVCTEPWTEEADLMPGLEAREEPGLEACVEPGLEACVLEACVEPGLEADARVEPWLGGRPAEVGLQDAEALFGRATLCASFRTTVTSTKP